MEIINNDKINSNYINNININRNLNRNINNIFIKQKFKTNNLSNLSIVESPKRKYKYTENNYSKIETEEENKSDLYLRTKKILDKDSIFLYNNNNNNSNKKKKNSENEVWKEQYENFLKQIEETKNVLKSEKNNYNHKNKRIKRNDKKRKNLNELKNMNKNLQITSEELEKKKQNELIIKLTKEVKKLRDNIDNKNLINNNNNNI